MAENVGGIVWTAEMRTEQLLTAQRDINRSTNFAEASFTRVDKAARRMGGGVKRSAKGVSKAMGGMGRSAGQAGIQVQQLVGQVQGGVNPMVALSQQGADLGFVLGAPLLGAVVGISAALATFFMPALGDSTTAVEKLEEAIKEMDKVAEQSDGTTVLTERLQRLFKVSAAAARAELIVAMQRAEMAATEAAETMSRKFIDAVGPIQNLGFEMGLVGKEAQQVGIEFGRMLLEARTDPSIENFKAVQAALGDIIETAQETGGTVSPAIIQLYTDISELASNAVTLRERAQGIKEAFDELPKSLDASSESAVKAKESINEMIGSLEQQAATAGMSERQMAIYAATMMAAKNPTIDLAAAVERINAAFNRIDAAAALAASNKELAAASEQAEREFSALVTQWQNGMMALQSSEAQRQSFIDNLWMQGTAAGQTREQIQRLADGYRELWAAQDAQQSATALETLQAEVEAYRQGAAAVAAFNAEKALGANATSAEIEQYVAMRAELDKLKEEAKETGNALADVDWGQFGDQAIGAFASVATGAMDGREAIRGLALSVAQTLIGALIKTAILGEGLKQKETASGIAQAGALTSAYAPAAAAASVATGGGAAASGLTALATVIPAMLGLFAGLAFGGGRRYGGSVASNKMYEVNEGGLPELYQSGGKQYLLPNSRGEVVSNKDARGMMGGSGAVSINVHNYGSEKVDLQTRDENDGGFERRVIDVFVGDMYKRGRTHKAFLDTSTASNRTRGR